MASAKQAIELANEALAKGAWKASAEPLDPAKPEGPWVMHVVPLGERVPDKKTPQEKRF